MLLQIFKYVLIKYEWGWDTGKLLINCTTDGKLIQDIKWYMSNSLSFIFEFIYKKKYICWKLIFSCCKFSDWTKYIFPNMRWYMTCKMSLYYIMHRGRKILYSTVNWLRIRLNCNFYFFLFFKFIILISLILIIIFLFPYF